MHSRHYECQKTNGYSKTFVDIPTRNSTVAKLLQLVHKFITKLKNNHFFKIVNVSIESKHGDFHDIMITLLLHSLTREYKINA